MNCSKLLVLLKSNVKLQIYVADTLWSVHTKIDFHQKKTMLKAETEAIKRQRKDCEQSKHEKRDEQTITFSQCC